MSKSHIKLTDSKKVIAEQLSQVEGSITHTVQAQGVHVLPVGAMPRPKVLTSANMATTAANYDFAPESPDVYRVEEIRLRLSSGAAMEMGAFGNLSALTTGLSLTVRNASTELYDLLDGSTLKTLNDLALYGDLKLFEQATSFTALWSFKPPSPVRLEQGDGELIRVAVADDLSSLSAPTEFYASIRVAVENVRS